MPILPVSKITANAGVFGKYLDQPALVEKLYNVMPAVLTGTAAGYGIYDTMRTQPELRKKRAVKNASVLGFTVVSALLATRGLKIKGKEIFEGIIELPEKDKDGIAQVLTKPLSKKAKQLVEKVDNDRVLKFSEVKELMKEFKDKFKDEKLISKVIPDAESEAPFADLLKLSWLGLIPVLGGIAGGVVGDKLVKDDWKKQFPDKVKEGTYQYLNNIALCNVGAGLGALAMNAFNVKSKTARFAAMLTGVLGVGLVASNAIANFIGKNYINPLFDKNKKHEHKTLKEMVKNLNSERHPEALDVSLHLDDVASVGFVSGLKWIGPVLPMLYSVSAYRAGIGYRNGNQPEQQKQNTSDMDKTVL